MAELSKKNFEARRGRVGASEIAALLDCGHPYRKPYDLFANIVHGIDTFAGNALAAEMGHTLEPVVIRMGMSETGLVVRRNSLTRKHPTLPLAATYDAVVVGTKPPEVVECKTASAYLADEWKDPMGQPIGPPHYIAQVQAQLMISGGPRGYLWVLIGGRDFASVEVPRDEAIIAQIEERLTAFYAEHIIPRVAPDATPNSLLWAFDIPEGVGAASGTLEIIGLEIARLMESAANTKTLLGEAREALIGEMRTRKLALATHTDWTAEAKPAKDGKMGLRFTRSRT